jgi:hypothetical protein
LQCAAGQHLAAALRADIDRLAGKFVQAVLPSARRAIVGRRCGKQAAAEGQFGGAMAVGQEADVTDAVEAVRHQQF